MPAAALVITAIAAVASTTASIVAGNQQRASARHAADLQEQAQQEQRAGNAAQAAQERRQQVREERVRRARIEQASANTGTQGSAGELGAVGSIDTQTSSNIGFNLGAIQRGNNISNLNQEAATTIFEGKERAAGTQAIGSIFQTVGSVAGSYYGSTGKAKIPSASTVDTSFDNPSDYG